MKKFLFLFLFLFLSVYISEAQTTIVGTLKHSTSKENISFVNVYVASNTSIGTVSNANGDFTIKIPSKYSDVNLVFSSIGFKKKVLKVEELARLTDPVIYLVPETTELETVVLLSKYPNPKKILRKAINRINRNYVNKSYQEDFFYRQINYRGERVSRVIEASLNLSDAGYTKNVSKLKLSVSELRKTRDLGFQDLTASLFSNLTTPMGNPHFVFNYDYVRGANTQIQGLSFRNNLLQVDSTFSVFEDFEISLENAIMFDEDLVFVILLKEEKKGSSTAMSPKAIRRHIESMDITDEQKEQMIASTFNVSKKKNSSRTQYLNTTRLYVNAEDFAILKIDTETIRDVYTDNVLKGSGLLFRATTQYTKKNNKYSLLSIQALAVDLQKGQDGNSVKQFKEYELLRSSYENKSSLNANNFSEILPNVDIYNLNFLYNKEFWNTYNIIKMKSLNFTIDETLFETDDLEDIFIKN